jgi:tRNA threonylcarbamoyladenosine biosynthesis protein TsaB
VKPPVLLAIDSSTETLCLAACAGGRDVVWHGIGGAQASAVLLARAQDLLARVDAGLGQLDAVAFARGPGAFTGLRTACASAQGLAFGVGCGVLPLDSLLIVAQATASKLAGAHALGAIGVVMDARMGELYAGLYLRSATGWDELQPPMLMAPQALADRWVTQSLQCVVGTGVPLLAATQPGPELCQNTVVVDDAERTAAMLVLAQAAWQAGASRPPEDALPLYVRDKVAQTSAERRALAQGSTVKPQP